MTKTATPPLDVMIPLDLHLTTMRVSKTAELIKKHSDALNGYIQRCNQGRQAFTNGLLDNYKKAILAELDNLTIGVMDLENRANALKKFAALEQANIPKVKQAS